MIETNVYEEIERYLQVHSENGYFMGSVLVASREKVLSRRGYGMANLEHDVPNTPQTKFRLASLTKQFTAAAILKLQEQELLDVHSAVASYLPEYLYGSQITVHQLLNHTAGIPNFTSFEDYHPIKKRIPTKLDDLIAWFSDRPLEFTPGERFSYSNSGYAVLTKIIETVSGLSYADFLQKHIFKPLEMHDSGYDRRQTILKNRASGYVATGEGYQHADYIDMSAPEGTGGLYSTVEDLYKWERSLYTDVILNRASREAMFTSTVRTSDSEDGVHHSYGWFVNTKYDRRRISFNGGVEGFFTHIARYPDEQVVIVVLNNLQVLLPLLPDKMGLDIAAILFGKPYELPQKREAIDLDPAIYENYVGRYKFAPAQSLPPSFNKLIFTVTTDGKYLFIQWTGQEAFRIYPKSSTKFFSKTLYAQITFGTDDEGRSQLIIHRNRDTLLTKID